MAILLAQGEVYPDASPVITDAMSQFLSHLRKKRPANSIFSGEKHGISVRKLYLRNTCQDLPSSCLQRVPFRQVRLSLPPPWHFGWPALPSDSLLLLILCGSFSLCCSSTDQPACFRSKAINTHLNQSIFFLLQRLIVKARGIPNKIC